MVLPGARVFATCAAYRPDPHDASAVIGREVDAASLLRGISSDYATPSYGGVYFKRRWQEPYLLALVADIADRVSPCCTTTVDIGAARYASTSCIASSTEAHLFVDLRAVTLVGMLAHRLRRMVEVAYEPSRHHSIGLLDPLQTLIQARGLVAQILQASMLDALDGRSDVAGPVLSSLGRLADRIGEGLASLHWLSEISNAGDAGDESLPSWNPIAPAFAIGHEFGHLLLGGNARGDAFRAGSARILTVFDTWRRVRDVTDRSIAALVETLAGYDHVNAERCHKGLDLFSGDGQLTQEPLADIIGLICAVDVLAGDIGLKIPASRSPEPATDLLLWQATVVATSIAQAAKRLGVEAAHEPRAERGARFTQALAVYLIRSTTSVLCTTMYASDEVTAGDVQLYGERVLLAGLQCLTELCTMLDRAFAGVSEEAPIPPPTDEARGAQLLGLRQGAVRQGRFECLAAGSPSEAWEEIVATHADNAATLFDMGAQPEHARLRRAIETVPETAEIFAKFHEEVAGWE